MAAEAPQSGGEVPVPVLRLGPERKLLAVGGRLEEEPEEPERHAGKGGRGQLGEGGG